MIMDIQENIRNWRRSLHQIPELGLEEYKTTEYLRIALQKMGYHPLSISKTGLIVYIDHHQSETIAFRCDIDGLPIAEKNDCSYVSLHPGRMHACGHDGHMSALLGFALFLKQSQEKYRYNVLLLFQPAEEIVRGAHLFVSTGIFEKYHVKAIFGMHLTPDIEEGTIASRPGALMAQGGELEVTIHGKQAHVGRYYEGVNSIAIASQLLQSYQTIRNQSVSPMQPSLLHIGKIEGGYACNIVADKVVMHGCLRTLSKEVYETIIRCMEQIHQGLEKQYGCHITYHCPPLYPPVTNDPALYKAFTKCITSTYEEISEPSLLGEDFSYYQEQVPGVYFYLGTKNKQFQSGLHTDTFNFRESVLLSAIDAYHHILQNIRL